MTLDQAVELARKRCAEKKVPYCVIDIDKDDGREVTICTQEYTRYAEFEAFDGHVLADVYPEENGMVSVRYVR